MDASKSAQLAPGGEIAVARARAAAMLVRRDRWRAAEVLPWLAAVAAFFTFPSQMVLGGPSGNCARISAPSRWRTTSISLCRGALGTR